MPPPGYYAQITSYFSWTARFGTPRNFMGIGPSSPLVSQKGQILVVCNDLFSEITVTDRAAEAYIFADSPRPAGIPLGQAAVSGGEVAHPSQLMQNRIGALQLRRGLLGTSGQAGFRRGAGFPHSLALRRPDL